MQLSKLRNCQGSLFPFSKNKKQSGAFCLWRNVRTLFENFWRSTFFEIPYPHENFAFKKNELKAFKVLCAVYFIANEKSSSTLPFIFQVKDEKFSLLRFRGVSASIAKVEWLQTTLNLETEKNFAKERRKEFMKRNQTVNRRGSRILVGGAQQSFDPKGGPEPKICSN